MSYICDEQQVILLAFLRFLLEDLCRDVLDEEDGEIGGLERFGITSGITELFGVILL